MGYVDCVYILELNTRFSNMYIHYRSQAWICFACRWYAGVWRVNGIFVFNMHIWNKSHIWIEYTYLNWAPISQIHTCITDLRHEYVLHVCQNRSTLSGCVAMCCAIFHSVTHCNVLQCAAIPCMHVQNRKTSLEYVAISCVVFHFLTHCNVLRRAATCYNTLHTCPK